MIGLLRASAGLIGWALAFSLIYALHGLVCSPRLSNWISTFAFGGRELLIGAWLICLALLSWLSWRMWPAQRKDSLLEWLAPILALTGLVATLFTGFPMVVATTCT